MGLSKENRHALRDLGNHGADLRDIAARILDDPDAEVYFVVPHDWFIDRGLSPIGQPMVGRKSYLVGSFELEQTLYVSCL